MKKFEINFRGGPIAGPMGNEFEAYLKLDGLPGEIGRALGEYADGLIRQKKDFTLAKILLNAYRIFLLKNPGITAEMLRSVADEPDGLINSPYKA